MKYVTILLFACALLTSCKNEGSVGDNAPAPTANPTAPAAAPATVNIIGGAHYVCTLTGCAGVGAAGAGSCEVCGNALAHNQGFHANDAATPQTANEGLSPLFTNPQSGGAAASTTTNPITTAPAATPEPAQNANGVWHYTCSNGCAGGAGSAIACAGCGSTLAHNQGYH